MGNKSSSPDKAKSRRIEEALNEQKDADNSIKKLLLLGPGSSGKSTIFKQMSQLYGTGFSDEEIKSFIPVICRNLIRGIQRLLSLTDDFPTGFEDCKVPDAFAEQKAYVMSLNAIPADLNEKTGKVIKELWALEEMKNAFAKRSNFQLDDCVAYYCDKAEELCSPSYVPAVQDMLLARAKTTGITEKTFLIDNVPLLLVDVGGQRNERKKWIHCFSDVTSIVFVAAMSEYDQKLYEDESVVRIEESLNVFEEVVNNEAFENTAIILFLNKVDLYREKFKKVPITVFFKDFTGDVNDEEETTEHFKEAFTGRVDGEQEVHCHVTCATDTSKYVQPRQTLTYHIASSSRSTPLSMQPTTVLQHY